MTTLVCRAEWDIRNVDSSRANADMEVHDEIRLRHRLDLTRFASVLNADN